MGGARGDIKTALGMFRKAVEMLEGKGARRSLMRRDEAIYVFYARLLAAVAQRMERERKPDVAERFRQEAGAIAAKYLERQPKGLWAQSARELTEVEQLES